MNKESITGKKDKTGEIPGEFIKHAVSSENLGTMTYASGSAKGSTGCGDAVEIQLRISRNVITDIKSIPHGCINVRACASALGKLVKGQGIETALAVSPGHIAQELGGLPEAHMHCPELVVNTLKNAVDDYSQKSSYWADTRFWDKQFLPANH